MTQPIPVMLTPEEIAELLNGLSRLSAIDDPELRAADAVWPLASVYQRLATARPVFTTRSA